MEDFKSFRDYMRLVPVDSLEKVSETVHKR